MPLTILNAYDILISMSGIKMVLSHLFCRLQQWRINIMGDLKTGCKYSIIHHRMPSTTCNLNLENTGGYFTCNMKNILKIYNIKLFLV